MESTACFGPSPLTRGNPARLVRQEPHAGSIPAHAGQPGPCASSPPVSRVYPRSRGATNNAQLSWALTEGPSPLSRGNLLRIVGGRIPVGSIPAHAGQPAGLETSAFPTRVHPRSRGATHPVDGGDADSQGPSPLTRGNPAPRPRVRAGDGSIPAHAGQPRGSAGERGHGRVHPRSRGATVGLVLAVSVAGGPSPLTRGTPTRSRRPPCNTGPSPLTRGNRDRRLLRHAAPGSIPAHAGQPQGRTARIQGGRVHPRSRGATHALDAHLGAAQGPSPLTRGNLRVHVAQERGLGSIPAHAGQPICSGKE